MSSNSCGFCGATDLKLLRCARCKIVCYCSKEHQREDWKRKHKKECFVNEGDIGEVNFEKSTNPIVDNIKDSKDKKSKPGNKIVAGNSNPKESDNSKTGNEKTEKKLDESLTTCRNKPVSTTWRNNTLFDEGSFESEILNARTEVLSAICGDIKQCSGKLVEINPVKEKENLRAFAGIRLNGPPFLHCEEKTSILEEVSLNVIHDMDAYGVCVVDHFLGPDLGRAVLDEVISMYSQGVFKDGQTVNSRGASDLKTVRGDQIVWLDGKESHCKNIGALISKVDIVIKQANEMSNNGKMGSYVINGRTKAMVACYPAQGSHYVKHVDNPNHDGRCITAIYYLNTDWDIQRDGGLLRIFPAGWQDQVADIEPLFDRILFFWSDRRNPHEVQPSFRTRYAITLWYFDAIEREEATRRHQEGSVNSS